jgi:hypothetical protein
MHEVLDYYGVVAFGAMVIAISYLAYAWWKG